MKTINFNMTRLKTDPFETNLDERKDTSKFRLLDNCRRREFLDKI